MDKSTGNEDKDCGGDKDANKAGSANKTGSANNAGMNKDGKRPADDDSGDAHLSREGTRKRKLSLKTVPRLSYGCMQFICVCLNAV